MQSLARAYSVAILLLMAGCRSTPRSDSAASAGTEASSGPPPIQVQIPSRWEGRYGVDTLSTRERGTALPGAREYYYRPLDLSFHREVLAVVAVYDSTAWAAVLAEGGPPPGDSVGASGGRVYVVALPQSNPFPTGTPDAASFDTLQLRPNEVATFVILH